MNEATAKGKSPDPDKPDVPVTPGEVTVPTEDPNGHLTVTKAVTSQTPATGYALGDVISYRITATNDGNLTITNVTVSDELTGDNWTVASLAPGASREFEASYTVTEADVLAGSVVNTATAKGTTQDPDEPDVPVTPGDVTVPTEDPNGHLTVTKAVTSTTPEAGYALGDVITYRITATNDGNLTITNITVTDELTGDNWTVASLVPGASREFNASYTVTEADVLAGSVVNTATAKGTTQDPDQPDVPVVPGDVTVPTEEPDGHLTVTKVTTSTAPERGYALGDTITYRITATNDGNLTITNITVTDELTGDEWTVASLAPGASEEFTASYTVTAADATAGRVVNVATAKGTSPDPDLPDVPVTPGEDTETIGTNPTPITVTITGHQETLEYDGQIHTVTGYDVSISSPLYTEADFSFSGSATATGRTAGNYAMNLAAGNFANTNPSFTNVTFVVVDGGLVITPKPITITGGDNGTYTVTGLNEGDTIVSIVVTPVQREDGSIVNVPSGVVIRNADGETVTTSYTVNYVNGTQTQYRLTVNYWINEIGGQQAAGSFSALYASVAAYNVTSPALAGYVADIPRVSGTITGDTVVDVVYTEEQYRLTIYYLFNNGSQAAETYTAMLAYGEGYDVVSPEIEGYNVNFAEVAGEMPARNMIYTVRYWTDDEMIINDYETPLGVPNMSMSTGETYE